MDGGGADDDCEGVVTVRSISAKERAAGTGVDDGDGTGGLVLASNCASPGGSLGSGGC
jgi:hypothetical protein